MQPVAVRVVRREGERNIRDRTMRKSCHMHRGNRLYARASENSRRRPCYETANRNAFSKDREYSSADGLSDQSQTRLMHKKKSPKKAPGFRHFGQRQD